MENETSEARAERRQRALEGVRHMSDRELDSLIARSMGKHVEEGPAREGEGIDYYMVYFGYKVTEGDITRQPRVPSYSSDQDANDEMIRWAEAQATEVRGRYRRWAFSFAPGFPTARPGTPRTRAEAFALAIVYEVEA